MSISHHPGHEMRQSEITTDILKPLVDEGLSQKAIAERLGVDRQTVRRRMKACGLKKKVTDNRAAPFSMDRIMTKSVWEISRDPLLRMRFSTSQQTAALQLRTACQESIGVKGQDLIKMMCSRSGFGPNQGLTDNERAAEARTRMSQWIKECARREIDVRPAVMIGGHGIPLKVVAAELGLGTRRAERICKESLDVMAKMFGWAPSGRPRRHAWQSELSTVLDYEILAA